MQIYRKNIKNYLILGIFLAYIGFCLGNIYSWLPGYNMISKFHFLFYKELSQFLSENLLLIFFRPTLIGTILAFISFLIALLLYVKDNDSGVYRQGEEHGSSRYATIKEISRFQDSDPQKNIILTRNAGMGIHNKRLAPQHQKNKNGVAVGGPGTGKTRNFVKPNIMQMNSSFIVVDPKGLLIKETGKMLEDAGYQIKIFNLDTLSNSDGFNVFSYIKTELDIDRVLEAITEGTRKGEQKGEDFWNQAEALLIRSFIAFLWFDGQDNSYLPHLGMIADMLRFTERKDPKEPSPVEQWFEEQHESRPNNYAYKQWSLFNDLYKSETRMSVLSIAAGRYSVFDHEEVVNMVRYDTMNIESWNTKKTAVFLAIPETSTSFNFIGSIMLATALETLRKKADGILIGDIKLAEGESLLHVRWLIDECANIGKIPNLDRSLATFRSREMSIVLVLQALDQLKTMYPKGWATLINTCDTLLFLGGDEKETTEYLSKRAGKQTLSVRKHSLSKGRGSGSENRDKMSRDLLDPSEIGRINGQDALVFISGEHVFKDKKFTVEDHPNASLLANDPEDDNWYNYKRYFSEAEKILDMVSKEEVIFVDHGVIGSEEEE